MSSILGLEDILLTGWELTEDKGKVAPCKKIVLKDESKGYLVVTKDTIDVYKVTRQGDTKLVRTVLKSSILSLKMTIKAEDVLEALIVHDIYTSWLNGELWEE